MNSLFLRLWLAIWFVIVIVVFSSVGLFEYLRSIDSQIRVGPPHAYLQSIADELKNAMDSGETAKSWLAGASMDRRPVYLIDGAGNDLINQTVPAYLIELRTRMDRIREHRRSGMWGKNARQRPGRISLDIDLPGYSGLTLISPRGSGRPSFRWFSPGFLIVSGFLISGLAAVGLARYVTFPIKQLKAASDLVAQGDFHTNVSASVGSRKDELADLARRFDQMAGALGSAQTLQQNLLTDISHELRSPLTRLLLTADLITIAEGVERQKLESRFKKDLADLEQLVDEVMTLARFDAEAGLLQFSSVDVVEQLSPIFDDAQFEANALNKSVKFEYPDQPLHANVDAHQLRRAVENVVRNAIRHTPENTTVHASVLEEAGDVVITIQDQGDGVDEKELRKIFRPFYRTTSARSQWDGSGIGLALADRILKAHNGRVSAHSVPGSGLRVCLTLPNG